METGEAAIFVRFSYPQNEFRIMKNRRRARPLLFYRQYVCYKG
jgi:hypothetical protein